MAEGSIDASISSVTAEAAGWLRAIVSRIQAPGCSAYGPPNQAGGIISSGASASAAATGSVAAPIPGVSGSIAASASGMSAQSAAVAAGPLASPPAMGDNYAAGF